MAGAEVDNVAVADVVISVGAEGVVVLADDEEEVDIPKKSCVGEVE